MNTKCRRVSLTVISGLAVLALSLAACGPKATECPTPAGSGCVPEGFRCTIASPSQTCTCTNGVLICRVGDGG